MMKYLFTNITFSFFVLGALVLYSCSLNKDSDVVRLDISAKPFGKISDYAFFKHCNDFTKPNKGVIPYKQVNVMFNDYASTKSFMYLPEGQIAGFDSNNLMILPVGACLINVVYYPKDEEKPDEGKQLIETQLLIRKSVGWESLNYVWSDDQNDAILNDEGSMKPIKWLDKNGHSTLVNFIMPSKSECKGCHLLGNQVTPIGVNAANLNLEVNYPTGKKNQLDYWLNAGLMKNYAKDVAPKCKSWRDTSASLDERARAYLNANCAHCHNAKGPAFVSGLFLNAGNNDKYTGGICKAPLSKGHGTCYLNYDIVPGRPTESVIVCRMATTEFGVKMPETGRTLVDTAGVALISQWIAALKGDCR